MLLVNLTKVSHVWWTLPFGAWHGKFIPGISSPYNGDKKSAVQRGSRVSVGFFVKEGGAPIAVHSVNFNVLNDVRQE